MLVRNPQAREIFAKHGCHVDTETEAVAKMHNMATAAHSLG